MSDQLSPHFQLIEFQRDEPIPPELEPIFKDLANLVLEPMRAQAGCAFLITSGYRSPEGNLDAHGQPNSEHMATQDYCAADFALTINSPGMTRALFDWARMDAALPFRQLILEHGKTTSIIHVSYNRAKPGVRSVLEGQTNNAGEYTKWAYVPYEGPAPGQTA